MMRLLLMIMISALSLMGGPGFADNAFDEGRQAARAGQGAIRQGGHETPDRIFTGYTDHPQAAQHYNAGQADRDHLTTAGARAAARHDGVQAVQSSRTHRPDVPVDHAAHARGWQRAVAQSGPVPGRCGSGDCPHAQAGGPNPDFNEALSALNAVQAAGRSYRRFRRIFEGRALHCRDKALGYSNCCAYHGWGQDLNLAHCNDEERALAKARAHHRVVELGRYCAHRHHVGFHKKCTEHKQTACVFPGQLAQIIQRQGRDGQLHQGFGDAKNPDCRGITPQQMQQLDFNRMDFSEYTQTLQNQMAPADANQVKQQLQQAMQREMARGGRS
jgi:hypothetical protein